jgi:hypothetical protein
MTLALQSRWHVETAMTAASAPSYARAVCGSFGIEQVKAVNPCLDPSPPDS